ncbi:mitogen-activated protein kinase kinase kinase YODA-like protein [Cinnamomum micranthum f. kanehirae]|uniref:Mitogen-activated protein kinase kinase kinase YODA-like protein n=1 Tax=Cinnamomum micranthum f. kanehirae TaxID=337451 RepID=A0A3S4N7Q6_9MAGN|nr:mitogen-activated protein kinase kinase kinase YODA-like protein [Cinnamomum micranthum f. kanehirae]
MVLLEWERGAFLGKGSFGCVNLVRTRNHGLPTLVVKSTLLSNFHSFKKEMSILPLLQDCPQIVRCFGVDFTVENNQPLCNLFLEYVSGGTLADLIDNLAERGDRMREEDVRLYTKSILLGLRHIHQKGLVHCDIKPANILVASLCSCEVKIADFGLAQIAGIKDKRALYGTLLYMSPESVLWGDYDCPCDIWALGCCVLEMIIGKHPWSTLETKMDVLRQIGADDGVPQIPSSLSFEGKDFLGRCFERDPSKRWTAEMLLKHPFVSEKMQAFSCSCLRSPVKLSSQEKEDEILLFDSSSFIQLPDNFIPVTTCSSSSLEAPQSEFGCGFTKAWQRYYTRLG